VWSVRARFSRLGSNRVANGAAGGASSRTTASCGDSEAARSQLALLLCGRFRRAAGRHGERRACDVRLPWRRPEGETVDLGLEVPSDQSLSQLVDVVRDGVIDGYSKLGVPKRYAKPRPRLRFPGGSFRLPLNTCM